MAGAPARLAYAERLYVAFVLRQLEDLSLRIWDGGDEGPESALATVQRLLDALNGHAGSIVLVRDARWLLHTAQGSLTGRLDPYFTIADRIAGSFTTATRLEIHMAGAKLAGGHLRSQLRHRMADLDRAAEDPLVLAMTRNSNAMDLALLVRDLGPLLEAYKDACACGVTDARRDLADAIVQGLSADPELLVMRLDLLEPYTMIEDLFIRVDADGHAACTGAGARHLAALASVRLAHRRTRRGAERRRPRVRSGARHVFAFGADLRLLRGLDVEYRGRVASWRRRYGAEPGWDVCSHRSGPGATIEQPGSRRVGRVGTADV